MKLALSDIRRRCAERPENYYQDVVLRGQVVNDEYLILDDAVYAELCRKYSGQRTENRDQPATRGCC